MSRKKEIIIVALIIVLASFLRIWSLDSIPPGLYHDVAVNGNDALDALKSGDFKLFYTQNNGREGFFINLIALNFFLFGASIFSMRFTAAIIGILTILGMYLLCRELFKNKLVAMLSMFFLATSFWHLNFSRFGFRAIMVPFCMVFSFYFLAKALKNQRLKDYIISGVFFGLGFHTYISFRMAVLILIVPLIFVISKFWRDYKLSGKFWGTYIGKKYFKFDIWLLAIFLVALPIGIYFLINPQDFISRASGVSVFSQSNIFKAFFGSLAAHLGMFNFHGDDNWRHNLAGTPMLPWPLGILFLAGFIISLKEIIISIKNKDFSSKFNHWLIMVWFFVMLLPGILTYEGVPHALRVIGAIPPVYIFSGIGGLWLFEKTSPFFKNKKIFITLCLLFVMSIGYKDTHKYFIGWAKNPQTADAFSQYFVEIGNYLNTTPDETKKYVIKNEETQTPIFLERASYGKSRSTYIDENDLDKLTPENGSVILPIKNDEKVFEKIQTLFPNGLKVQERNVWIYKIF